MKKIPPGKEIPPTKPKPMPKTAVKSPSTQSGTSKQPNLQPEVLPYTAKIAKKPPIKPQEHAIPSFEEYRETKNKNKVAKAQQSKGSNAEEDETEETIGHKNDPFDPRETYNVSATGTFNGRFTNTGENRYVYEDNDHDFDNEVIEEEEYTHGGGHNNSTFQRLDQSDRMNDTQHFHEFPKKNNFKIDNHMNIDRIAMFK